MEEKKQNWFSKHKVITGIAVIVVLSILFGHPTDTNQPNSKILVSPTIIEQPTATPAPETKQLTLGDEGYLRIPNNKDPEQIILLATDKKYIDDVSKTLLSKDTQGFLELATKGEAIGVHVGSQIKIIDTTVGERRVRILKGAKNIDSDKEGMSGWVAFEFVSAK